MKINKNAILHLKRFISKVKYRNLKRARLWRARTCVEYQMEK